MKNNKQALEKLSQIKKRYGILGVIIVLVAVLMGQVVDGTQINDIEKVSHIIEVNDMSLEAVSLKRVVDGDTLVVTNSNQEELRVRLIGIDTPESVHPDEEKNTAAGDVASEYTKSLLTAGQTLYLEYDQEKEDKYGRTLAYVWLSADSKAVQDPKNNLLNAKLVADGYAKAKTYKPNTKYEQLLKSLEN